MQISLTAGITVLIACLTLFLGKYLNLKVGFFRKFNIPEPVTGGVLMSTFFGILYMVFGLEIQFDLALRDSLLIIFFTTIGLSAKFSTLMKGGKSLFALLFLAVIYLFVQNVIGLSVMGMFGFEHIHGLLGGSISLSGGHGTTIAWAPIFNQQYGMENAMELGIASATFGLVIGGVMGGPIAKGLISKYKLTPKEDFQPVVGVSQDHGKIKIEYDTMLLTIFTLSVSISLGLGLKYILDRIGLNMPHFVTSLFCGILITNILPFLFPKSKWTPENSGSIALWSDISLGLFLAMSLMSLQLWTLIDLAGPLFVILIIQVVVITLYVILVVFRVMGKDYDAAVISAGYMGLALGATPTAIANMTAVTQKWGGSPRAFIVVPLVGAFFIDLSNALIIKLFLSVFG
ncbi:MAG: sodium/glutamate symporter [Reichenbachiella sp.]